MTTFPERLRHLMAVRGLSQGDLARMLGIHQGEISHILSGRRGGRATYAMVSAIARHGRCDLEWLGEGIGDPPTAEDEPRDEVPCRSLALRIGREGGLPEHALDYLAKLPAETIRDWSTLQLINALQMAATLPGTVPPPSPPATVAPSHVRPRADSAPSTRRSTHHKK